MPGFYICNGTVFREEQPSLHPDNRSFRYGDGLFETIRVSNGRIPLWDLHMQRLFNGLQTLHINPGKLFHQELLLHQSIKLCQKNSLRNARLRITVSRGEVGILEVADPTPVYTIQTWPLDDSVPHFNTNGLHLAVFNDGLKSTDQFAHLKSTNYLIYAMAALHARQVKANDAIVLNHALRAADCSIANIFWVENNQLFTVAPTEGPVAGVMQQYLQSRLNITASAITPAALATKDEVFVTNAVRGIQWVGQLEQSTCPDPVQSRILYQDIILPLFS